MKDNLLTLIILTLVVSVCGCKSIVVGGSAETGGVHGGGSVRIPMPQQAP